MSKAYQGYENLQELKYQEIQAYYLNHQEVIELFLKLQEEYRQLGNKATQTLMNQVDELIKSKRPAK